MTKYILVKDELYQSGGDNYKYHRDIGKKMFLTDEEILMKCDASLKNDDVYPDQRRVIAIGDIHGDLEALLVLLEEVTQVCKFNCQIRNNNEIKSYRDIPFEWIGGDTFIVIVGDIIDRKRDGSIEEDGLLVGEIENEEEIIMDLLNKITLEADKKGGKLIKLLGNHEVMNLFSCYNYVSKRTMKDNGGVDKRKELTKPGGMMAQKIIKCGTLGIVKIGDWIFVHGGILPALVKAVKKSGVQNFISKANELARNMFLNTLSKTDDNKNRDLIKLYFVENDLEKVKREDFENEADYTKIETDNLINKRNSMLNERRLSIDNYAGIKVPISSMCSALRHAFKLLGYDSNINIVVAHSVQLERGLLRRSKTNPGYVSGYVYKNLESDDAQRYVYVGPGKKYTKNLSNTDVDDVFPHGLNFECPHDTNNPQSGQLWRIDTGVSRGFDNDFLQDKFIPKKLVEKILKARRPSALEILYDEKIGYTTKVLVAKKGLTREWVNPDDHPDEGDIFKYSKKN